MFIDVPNKGETLFTFGADPEVFFRRRGSNDLRYFVPAEGIIPGSKEDPFKVNKGAIQVDGMAAEFNIDPAKTKGEFFKNILTVLKELKKYTDKHNLTIVPAPVAYFTEEDYEKASEKAKELGCNPDFNAYTGKPNPRPNPPDELFRTGAGHIHIGWGKGFDKNDPRLHEAAQHVVKHLDTCVGEPLAMVAMDWKRRQLYGNEGCYRTTPFGLEYRTPSNFWLSSPDLVKFVINNTQLALKKSFETTKYDYQVPAAPRKE